MAKKFLVPLSVNGLASDPASGSEGDLYFNTVSKSLKIYKNGAWEEVGGAGNESASIIAYINEQIDDTYDLIFEGQYTDDIEEGVSNLYFTNQRALDAVGMPSQTGNAGKYLTTNGASTSWGVVDALPSQTGNSGKYLTTNGANPAWAVLDLAAGIQTASAAATASAFTYTDQQIALIENDPTNISFVRWNKVISASTSTISGLDDNNENLDYTPGIEQVFINGSFIPREDYTSTTGSSIVFDETLYVTDVVEVLCLKTVTAVTEEQLATSVDRWTKLMTASTATISGVDDYSNTLDYSIGYTTVYVNGILIDPSEYTATSGSAVVFDTTVNVDDVVEVLSYRNIGYIWDFYSLLNSASVAATASANSYTDAAIASFEALPSQTGNSGKYLTTNGASTSWAILDLNSAIVTASAAAAAYTDSELASIDLSAAIVTASAAAAAYTDSELASIDLSATIQTASAAAVTYLVDSAPGALDTLNELAAALGDDENFATTVTNSLATKLSISSASSTYATIEDANNSLLRWSKIYGASATVISGVDDNLYTLDYTPGFTTLFINGILVDPTNYTATSGSTVVLVDPISVDDVVEVLSYKTFNVANTYTKTEIDQKYNNYSRWAKTMSASTSTISGVDDNNLTLQYNPGYEEIFINGTLITNNTDYTATSGSAVVLVEQVVPGDIVEIVNIQPFNIANTYTTSQANDLFIAKSASTSFEPNIEYVSASPSGPSAGTLWIDSTNAAAPLLKVYNGTTWIAVSGSDSGLHPFFTAGI
jgi:hypothetical protein